MKRLILGITIIFFTILSSVNLSYAVNRILALDGDGDYVDIDTVINDIRSNTEGTISLWAKFPTQSNSNRMLSVSDSGDRKSFLDLYAISDGRLAFAILENSVAQLYFWTSPLLTTYDDNVWHHIVVTVDSSGNAFYVDGVQITDLVYDTGNPSTQAWFNRVNDLDAANIGRRNADGIADLYFNGLIDEASIWNRSLTKEEIQTMMAEGLPGDEEGLVGYWNFDDGTADDLSPFGNHGTLMGDAKIIPPINRALDLDGDGDSVQVLDNEALRLSNTDFTLEAWVYETIRSPDFSNAILVKRGLGQQNGWFWSITGERTEEVGHLSYGVSGGVDPYVLSSAIIPLNTWTHVAVVFTEADQTVKMFIDGNLDTSQSSIPTPNPTTTATLAIGNDSPESGQPYSFHGKIDEARIWNRALTQMEIWAQKDAILRGDEPGLIGYWRLDEPPGSTIAYDSSGNGNDGTLYGDADFVVSDAPLSTGAFVKLASVSGQKGETVNLPVIVENITGIVSLDLILSYDDNILTPGIAETTDLTTEWQIDSYIETPGAFNISIVNHSQVTEDGEMINIPFTIDASAPACTSMAITIEQALLNEEHIPVTTFDGRVSVMGRLGDVSLNGTITGYDAALVLQHTVGIINLTDCQRDSADVDISGEITAYDAAMILQYVVGRISDLPPSLQSPAIADITEKDARLVLPHVDFEQNQPIIVPITIEQKMPLVSSIELTLSYGNLKPIKVQKTALTKGYALAYNIQNNQIKIALAGSEPIKPNGAFVQVEFEPQEQSTASPLKISHIRLNRNLMQSVVTNSNIQIPQSTALLQNFPNPFNPETWIPYQLANEAEVTVCIYNLKGQLIRTLKLGNQFAGSYLEKDRAAYWNGQTQTGEPAASGLYFYTIQAHSTANGTGVEDFIATRRMILVK